MHCARGLIKQELRKTPKTNQIEPDISVHCPHCLRSGSDVLFTDIDKEKPVSFSFFFISDLPIDKSLY